MGMDRSKRLLATPLYAALVLLGTGCLKDGVLPARIPTEGDVSLGVHFVNGARPFSSGMWGVDGTGAMVRFSTLKFYLSNIGLYDVDSNRIAGTTTSELLIDAARPGAVHRLGRMSNGHVEEFRFVPGLDRTFSCETAYPNGHPYTDPSMLAGMGNERLHMHMAGYVDRNNNGHFDADTDVEFVYKLIGEGARPMRHFHMHADMVDGQELTLGIRVDLRILLLAVDIASSPTSTGNDALTELLLDNLAVAISPM
jgi:hypothetical protein